MFCFSCASLLYAYAFRPKTLPKEYYKWMVGKARVDPTVLQAHNELIQDQSIFGQGMKIEKDRWMRILDNLKATKRNKEFVGDYMSRHNGAMPGIPCKYFHPKQESCVWYCANLYKKTFVDILPVYMSLNAIPIAIFKFQQVVKK